MVKVSLQITSVDGSSTKKNDTITYVNPEATNETLREFATKLMALSNNTFVSAVKKTEETI